MAEIDMREWAVRGARQRLAEIDEERSRIYATFPELRRGRPQSSSRAVTGGSDAAQQAAGEDAGPARTGRGRRGRKRGARKRRVMSAEQRKAVSERMRKYWAARRKGQ
jgi:hypothetical protein